MTNTTEQPIWKPYPEYPFIEANQFGKIRTKDRYVPIRNGSKRLVKGRVLKQQLINSGYLIVELKVNGKRINLLAHRIIAASHLPNPNNYPEVNHIDNDPTNNKLENLEWCTGSYNCQYREKYGKAFGRPVVGVNLETSEVFWFKSQAEAARQLGINGSHITSVVKGKQNKTGGCWFTYADEKTVGKTRSKFGDGIANKVEKLINEHRN